jgi:hypothetical protein
MIMLPYAIIVIPVPTLALSHGNCDSINRRLDFHL